MRIDLSTDLEADSEIYQHAHLPVVSSYCRELGLIELINEMVPSKMIVRPGQIIQAMVLDTLSGRSPLYLLEDFMADQDIGLLIGENISPDKFNDTNISRALDAVFEVGTSKILTELGSNAAEKFGLDMGVVSYDTTSTNLWGDYRGCEEERPPEGPVITHGYSKDHRPDLKQFMTELLCVERGVPIFGRTLDGNSSDKTSNNEMLTNISSIMSKNGIQPGSFVYVADSAMVTEKNLATMGENLFISRLPANYGQCSIAIEKAVSADDWLDIGILAETKETKNRPSARYKGSETTVELHGKIYRAIVIHSTAHDSRRQKKIAKSLETSQKKIAKELKGCVNEFACETDALKAIPTFEKASTALHSIKANIIPVNIRKRGRPPKGAPAPTRVLYKIEWEVTENKQEVDRINKEAGCFVLITNAPNTGKMSLPIKDVLKTYKGQYGVESCFAFLKDPLITNDIFLKKPSRIDALGMVLVISLLVWRLMERSMRLHVEETGESMPGLNKQKTQRPTSYMLTIHMNRIMVMCTAKGERLFLRQPKETQMIYLKSLGLDETVFIDPKSRCRPKIPQKRRVQG